MKKFISITLCALLILSLAPVSAFAANTEKLTLVKSAPVILNGGFVKGLSADGNTLSEVKALFSNDAERISAFNGSDELTDADLVGTGAQIKLTVNSSVADTLTVIIYGDVDGDGVVTQEDYDAILDEALCISDSIEDGSVFEQAADVNNDTVIDAFDLSLIDLQLSDSKDIDQRGDLPEAVINEIDNSVVGDNGVVVIDGEEITVDTAFELVAPQTAEEIANKEYKDWSVDLRISFNKNVDGTKVYLAGQYAEYDWQGSNISDSVITANSKVSLINGWLGKTFTYEDIVNDVQTLKSALYVNDAADGLTLTVELVMTDPETGIGYTVSEFTYVYDRYFPEACIEDFPACETGDNGDGALTGYISNDVVYADKALVFTSNDVPEDVAGKACLDWVVDFEISFDRDVDGDDVYLFGQYGIYGWYGDKLGAVSGYSGTIAQGVKIALVRDLINAALDRDDIYITYNEILSSVQEFKTALHVEEPEDGLTVTVDLVMTNPITGERHLVSSYPFTYEPPVLPEIGINLLSKKQFGNKGSLQYGDYTVKADVVVEFVTNETAEDIADKPYKDWNVDFILSFSKDVDGNGVYLFGKYGDYDWTGGTLSDSTVAAGKKTLILKEWRGEEVPYSTAVDIHAFRCALDVVTPQRGLDVTLQIVMTNPDTGMRYVIDTFTHHYS